MEINKLMENIKKWKKIIYNLIYILFKLWRIFGGGSDKWEINSPQRDQFRTYGSKIENKDLVKKIYFSNKKLHGNCLWTKIFPLKYFLLEIE